MAHVDGYDVETNLKSNMIKNEKLSENGDEKQDQLEKKGPKKRNPRKGDPTKKDRKKETEEEKKNVDTNETSPSNDSSSSYKRVLECLEILQDGYSRMDVDRICEPLAENAIWMEHPHDFSRHYKGHAKIKELLKEEFSDVQETKIIFFPESLIHDEKRGVVNVEWLKTKQDTNPDGNHRERHSSHSVIIKFENDQIQVIRFHSIKTNKYWTKPLVRELDNEKSRKKRGKKKRNGKNGHRNGRNGHRNGGKNGRRNGNRRRRNGRRTGHRNGKNGHSNGKNGRKRQTRSQNGKNNHDNEEGPKMQQVTMNITENTSTTDVLEKPKPIAKPISKSSSRSQPRGKYNGGRGRNNGYYGRNGRDRNSGNRGRYPNGRYRKRGGRRGRGRRSKKKSFFPWTCSNCQCENTAEVTSCTGCGKSFDYNIDLTEEQKRQHWSSMSQEPSAFVEKAEVHGEQNKSGMIVAVSENDSVNRSESTIKEEPAFDYQNHANKSRPDQNSPHREKSHEKYEDDHKEAENNTESAGNFTAEN